MVDVGLPRIDIPRLGQGGSAVLVNDRVESLPARADFVSATERCLDRRDRVHGDLVP